MSEQTAEIEDKIQKRINSFFDNPDQIDWDHNSYWTKKVMSLLASLGQEEKLNVACNKGHGIEGINWGEWLYDMVWYEIHLGIANDGECLKDIHLVVESEWGSEYEIRRDFEKLIVARSKYRLMIFESNRVSDVKNIITDLKTIAKRCGLSKNGDRYMFAGYVKHEKRFHYELFVL